MIIITDLPTDGESAGQALVSSVLGQTNSLQASLNLVDTSGGQAAEGTKFHCPHCVMYAFITNTAPLLLSDKTKRGQNK